MKLGLKTSVLELGLEVAKPKIRNPSDNHFTILGLEFETLLCVILLFNIFFQGKTLNLIQLLWKSNSN